MNRLEYSILAFFLISLVTGVTEGIRCWVCDGKNSLKDCHAQFGRMQECPNPDDVCQNDYRTVKGIPLIIKGCKQAKACETEVAQNKNENQCGRSRVKKNLVCRCCCAFDGCNSKVSGCLPPPAPCKRIQNIRHGRVNCPTEIAFGSRCTFSCDNGYNLVGKNRAVCTKDGKGSKKGHWEPGDFPFCEKKIVRCLPPRLAPGNGTLVCKNKHDYAELEEYNYEGSICAFSCQKNFYLDGQKNSQCQASGKWNSKDPVCRVGSCKQPPVDNNRIETCTDRYKFGSTCTFQCKKGFTLVGEEESTCAQTGRGPEGFWSNRFPKCATVICYPEYTNPVNGKVGCSDMNFMDSVCTFSCNEGYDMDGMKADSIVSTCVDDKNGDAIGKWNGKPPTCTNIRCSPAFKNPINGQVVCTDRNNFGSVCTFTCNIGYDLDRTEDFSIISECKDDNNGDSEGAWSVDPGTCTPMTCTPPAINPEDGLVTCTDGDFKGSICTYHCDDDFDMVGTKKRTATAECSDIKIGQSIGKWSRPPPTCTPITCAPQPYPKSGFRICSTSSYVRGTFCVFYCNNGFDMVGKSYVTCEDLKRDGGDVGEWGTPTPSCKLGSCSAPEYDKETVVEECEAPTGFSPKAYKVNTKCTYTCVNEGHFMVPGVGDVAVMSGVTKTECTTDKKWTKKPPRCKIKTCLPKVDILTNGYTPKCTNNNNYNSKCEFKCISKYGLTHPRPLVCQADGDNDQFGKWSDDAPKCKRNECDEFGIIVNGKLNCSNGVKIGSVCDLQCIDRYTPKKYEETTCSPSAEWNRKKYVCCVRCLFNRVVTILSIFDSPTFETVKDWQYMVDFIETSIGTMIRFGFDVKFGAFRYAEKIDETTAIPFERLRSREALSEVSSTIQKMPITGLVSNTGNALAYATENYFKTLERGRENFVILVTSGNSNDDVMKQALALRERGVNILVVGFKSNKSSIKHLSDIAGIERNLLKAETTDDLRQLPEKINQISMTTGCTSASRTQPCP